MACEPKRLVDSATKSGFKIADVFIPILSAPEFKRFLISSHDLTPPPTVRGIKICFATFSTISNKRPLLSELAVISKKVNSSAPSSLYLLAISTGSPASFNSTKLIPFTTLPSFTSRHGIILLAKVIFLS